MGKYFRSFKGRSLGNYIAIKNEMSSERQRSLKS